MLRSHYRNYGEHKGLAQNCQNLVHKFLLSHFEMLGKEFSPKSWQYFTHYISSFVGYWHRLESQKISLVKTMGHLFKARIIYLVKYLCCKTERKLNSAEFLPKTKVLKCLWSKNFELQKCDHTGRSNYGLNLSIILKFLTIYGVGKSQCDHSNSR